MNAAAEEIAIAAAHDAAGRHDDAVNALALAAQRGDVQALTQLGARLVVGDRAPHLPNDGLGLLADAMQRGGAEAAERMAVLSALGAYVQPNRSAALELLGFAAERGAASARAQLSILCCEQGLAGPAREDGAATAPWRELARNVDLQAWTAVPSASSLSDSPSVRVIRDFLRADVCAWLIERAHGKLRQALIYDTATRYNRADQSRTNTVAEFSLMETDFIQALLQARMSAACGVPLQHMEAPAVLHYDTGEAIHEHFDFIDPQTPGYAAEIAEKGERIVTFLAYLNDDYDAGETEFPRIGVRHKGRRGDGLFFVNALSSGAPDLRTLHAGRPPTRGEKWIVSQFIRNRPTLPRSVR
jgi:hypothetical protein